MRLSLAAALLLVSLALFGSPSPSSAQKKNEFVHKRSGIAFPVPDGYATLPVRAKKPTVVIFGQRTKGRSAILTLASMRAPQGRTEDSLLPGMEAEALKSMGEDADFTKVGEASRRRVHGIEVVQIEYDAHRLSPDGEALRMRCAMVVRKKRLVVLGFCAPRASFAREVRDFDRLIEGVRWL